MSFKSHSSQLPTNPSTPVVCLNVASSPEASQTSPDAQSVSFWSRLFGYTNTKEKPISPDFIAESVGPSQNVMIVSEDTNGFTGVEIRPLSYAEKASLAYFKCPQKYSPPKPAVEMPLDSVYSGEEQHGMDQSIASLASVESSEYDDKPVANDSTAFVDVNFAELGSDSGKHGAKYNNRSHKRQFTSRNIQNDVLEFETSR